MNREEEEYRIKPWKRYARAREVNVLSRKVAERVGLKRNDSLDAGEYMIYSLNW